jgi:hypothetical protein
MAMQKNHGVSKKVKNRGVQTQIDSLYYFYDDKRSLIIKKKQNEIISVFTYDCKWEYYGSNP